MYCAYMANKTFSFPRWKNSLSDTDNSNSTIVTTVTVYKAFG